MKAEYISHMGNDLTVVNAARVSFDKESDGSSDKDNRLIKYLATHGHFSPFTHPQITLRYTVPIFVARQEFKHIVGFTRNETSRRYVDNDPDFFMPDQWRVRPDGSVKQGSGGGHPNSSRVTNEIYGFYDQVLFLYERLISCGVAPEQARMILPQSMYTSYYVTGSLAAFARFYKQRADSHAQKEIQDLAEMVQEVIEPLYPVSWKALTE
jgi:thymidylate synthase (FAD)